MSEDEPTIYDVRELVFEQQKRISELESRIETLENQVENLPDDSGDSSYSFGDQYDWRVLDTLDAGEEITEKALAGKYELHGGLVDSKKIAKRVDRLLMSELFDNDVEDGSDMEYTYVGE